jgi:hypothetical protein
MAFVGKWFRLPSGHNTPDGSSGKPEKRVAASRVCAINLLSGQVIALLRFETAVQEVFAVTVLPGKRYPELINDDEKLLENSFVVPDAALADVSPALRAPGRNGSAPHGALVKA